MNISVFGNELDTSIKTPNATSQTADNTFGTGIVRNELFILLSEVFKGYFDHLHYSYNESPECNRSHMVSQYPLDSHTDSTLALVIGSTSLREIPEAGCSSNNELSCSNDKS